MKLRSFLPRRNINDVPLLPTIEPDDSSPLRAALTRRKRDERLERLLTPSELDLVLHNQV
ncbi:hypothetical protein [Nocardia asteroides]|uniref:hypothetical protein n=1 Tax=Nocardia asteroides TaxID=1824 RepID=UPI001E599D90|nr:hypothetical protein [Nocardia asteroides]UGT58156.1 hypothetical protein LTT85_15535 [Nocardia asteroides]